MKFCLRGKVIDLRVISSWLYWGSMKKTHSKNKQTPQLIDVIDAVHSIKGEIVAMEAGTKISCQVIYILFAINTRKPVSH